MKKPIADPSDVWLKNFSSEVKMEILKKYKPKVYKKLQKIKAEQPLNKKRPYTLSKIAQDRIMPEDLLNE